MRSKRPPRREIVVLRRAHCQIRTKYEAWTLSVASDNAYIETFNGSLLSERQPVVLDVRRGLPAGRCVAGRLDVRCRRMDLSDIPPAESLLGSAIMLRQVSSWEEQGREAV